MPKIVCHRCRGFVEDHDFYIESRGGVVCSSCILAAESRSQGSASSAGAKDRSYQPQAFVPKDAWADAST